MYLVVVTYRILEGTLPPNSTLPSKQQLAVNTACGTQGSSDHSVDWRAVEVGRDISMYIVETPEPVQKS